MELLRDDRDEELNEDSFQVLQNIIRCLVSIFMSMSCMPEAYPTLENLVCFVACWFSFRDYYSLVFLLFSSLVLILSFLFVSAEACPSVSCFFF